MINFKFAKKNVFIFTLCGMIMACQSNPKYANNTDVIVNSDSSLQFPLDVKPPRPEKIDHLMKLHGDTRTDPYYWMKQRDSKKVLDHLQSENSYFEKMMAGAKPLQNKIFIELKNRVKQDDSTPPVRFGDYFYYTKFKKGLEYSIYCRKFKSLKAKEQVILDVNQLAKGHTFVSVADVYPSPDQQKIAYSVDFTGRRFYDIYIKDLKSGKIEKNNIPQTTGNYIWSNDNQTLFYTTQDKETLRSDTVFKFDLKNGQSQKIYFEKDEIFNVSVSKSQNKKFIFINSSSFDSSEVRFAEDQGDKSGFKIFKPRETKIEYAVEASDENFYVLTNWQAENFRVLKTEFKETDKKSWKEIIPLRSDVLLTDFLSLKNNIVLQTRKNGLTQLEVYDTKTFKPTFLNFPDNNYVVSLGTNLEFNADQIRYNYQSLVQPRSVYDYKFKSQKSNLVKQSEIPTYTKDNYQTDRIWIKAADGTAIPVSLLYSKKFKKDGTAPLLVYGYGSYGFSMDPDFDRSVFSLVDRGFVYAIAHVRGGSELGRYWYEKGRLNFKKNTFTDFVDVTQGLVNQGYANSKKVFALGGSAGGLLMGAITNLRPDLYTGVVAEVPFVDALTTMLDPDIPLTAPEYEQWGNPNELEAYKYIKSYSPYDNIGYKKYPAMLIMTGYHDSQVQYWEPAKYAAKLRDYTQSKNPILLRTNMEAGHSGATGRFQALEETAIQYSFFLNILGIKN